MKFIFILCAMLALSSVALISKKVSSVNNQTETIMKKDTIYYVFDPLCGWCYGFSPVINEFKEEHKENYHFEIISGGMMTGSRITPVSRMRDFMLRAYKQVEKSTGIKFGEGYFKTMEEDTAIYSSVEPSIALEVFRTFKPERTFNFASDIQKAIYFDGISPTVIEHYKPYAEKWGINGDEFVQKMKTPALLDRVNAGFAISKQLGVTGFPTVLLKSEGKFIVLTEGYTSLSGLNKQLEATKKTSVDKDR